MTDLHQHAKKFRPNPHQILNDIIFRWSPRSMTGKPLTKKDLLPLFEAARWAPSSNNNQEWHFYYALKNSSAFKDLFNFLTEGNQSWADKAGVLIIVVSQAISDYKDKPIRTHSFDTGAAWQALAIEGTRRNLVVHAMGGFDYPKATKYLKLSKKFAVQAMIAVGKPEKNITTETVSSRQDLPRFITQL